MTRPVHIAGYGLLCAQGESPAAVAASLSTQALAPVSRRLGEQTFPYFALPSAQTDWMCRAGQAFCSLAGQIGPFAPDTPLFIASSSFQIGYYETQGEVNGLPSTHALFSRQIAEWVGLSGPRASFSNACTSGFSAIDAAHSLIAAGQIDDAIVVGCELSNQLTMAGFSTMGLLSQSICRPFDHDRDGLVLGEAVAAVHLSARPGGWRIAGLRTGIDAFSITGPDPEGGPIAEIVRECLIEAGLQASDIELVKLQAAGSPGTDLAEANALRQLFANELPALVSLKSAIGHTLGASGVAELAALLACLDAGFIPATNGFDMLDPEIGMAPTTAVQRRNVGKALLNLIGFGGGLASMIIERNA